MFRRHGYWWARLGVLVLAAAAERPAPVSAQSPTILKPQLRKVELRARVPVSGGIRVGLQVPVDGRVVPGTTAAYVTIPPRAERTPLPAFVCLEVSSQDGQYSARFGYPLAPGTAGAVRLELEEADLRPLRPYSTGRIALLASLGNDCEREEPLAFLVARWHSASPSISETVTLLLNSRVPTFITRQGGPAGEELRCATIEGEAVAFNLRCELPASWLSDTTPLAVQQRRGRAVSSVAMTVRGR